MPTDRDRTEWFEETYDATRHAVAGTLRRTTAERRRTAAEREAVRLVAGGP
ncbi:hypothetical protein [Streptomyces sp. B6B3]|uniref:hypothetical protein n=1 Tax=Streptomyces sp. B6B3 TaxID=3153570 RepID=UPI00325D3320